MIFSDDALKSSLSSTLNQNFKLDVFDSIDSTNSYLYQQQAIDIPQICIAHAQSAGRGRFGKSWDSEQNKSLCLSVRIPMHQTLEQLMGFSLVIALAIKSSTQPMIDRELLLKWPNDILVDDKKLCGVLIETNNTSSANIDLIIGIGMNLEGIASTDYSAISLAECGIKPIYCPNRLATAIISGILSYAREFAVSGFAVFKEQWLEQDRWLDSLVTLTQTDGKQSTGVYRGIDDLGQILIQIDDTIKIYNAGEISLRRKQV